MNDIRIVKHHISRLVVGDQPSMALGLQSPPQLLYIVTQLPVARHVRVEPVDALLGRKVARCPHEVGLHLPAQRAAVGEVREPAAGCADVADWYPGREEIGLAGAQEDAVVVDAR